MSKLIDLNGKRFGKYTVINRCDKNGSKGQPLWICICDCGNIRTVRGDHLRYGAIKSCGCLAIEMTKKRELIDLTGKKFSRLTVLSRYKKKKWTSDWLCECICGNKTIVSGMKLRNGETKSCGCFHIESITKHGAINTPEYRTWASMKDRVFNKNNNQWKNYGGRGILICERWKNSFINFLEDMGYRPSIEYTIDRIDNNGNYCPENCKWSTQQEQNNNKRTNIKIEGMSMSEFCKIKNISYKKFSYHYRIKGKDLKTAIKCSSK